MLLSKINDVLLDNPSLVIIHRFFSFFGYIISRFIIFLLPVSILDRHKSFSLLLYRIVCLYSQYYRSFYSYYFTKKKFCELLFFRNSILQKRHNFECIYFTSVDSRQPFSDIFPLANHQQIAISRILHIFYGKKVLILGPAQDINSYQIADFEVVCLLNSYPFAVELSQEYPHILFVCFTNIGYYRRNHHKFLTSSSNLLCLIKPPLTSPLFHNYCVPSNHMIFGGSMGVQCVLYTLLHCSPNEIYLTGVNAYLQNSYKPGIKNYTPNTLHMINNLRRHEPISNYLFLRFCVLSNLVQTDPISYSFLTLPLDEYCKRLDDSYLYSSYSNINLTLHSR